MYRWGFEWSSLLKRIGKEGGVLPFEQRNFITGLWSSPLLTIQLWISNIVGPILGNPQLVVKRLYLFIISMQRQILESSVRGLPSPVPDHCPLLFDTDRPKNGPTPFRFKNMWLRDNSFKQNGKLWWQEDVTEKWAGLKIHRKLNNWKEKLKFSNRTTFGNVILKKNELLHIIQSFDKDEEKGVLRKRGLLDLKPKKNFRKWLSGKKPIGDKSRKIN